MFRRTENVNEDRYHSNYSGAPSDGTAWLSGGRVAAEMNRVAPGGSFASVGNYCRSATRNGVAPSSRGIVANAGAETPSAAHYVTRAEGGHGAVREVVELILKIQGRWNDIIEEYVK